MGLSQRKSSRSRRSKTVDLSRHAAHTHTLQDFDCQEAMRVGPPDLYCQFVKDITETPCPALCVGGFVERGDNHKVEGCRETICFVSLWGLYCDPCWQETFSINLCGAWVGLAQENPAKPETPEVRYHHLIFKTIVHCDSWIYSSTSVWNRRKLSHRLRKRLPR